MKPIKLTESDFSKSLKGQGWDYDTNQNGFSISVHNGYDMKLLEV